jgi:hypothetical protein
MLALEEHYLDRDLSQPDMRNEARERILAAVDAYRQR